VIASNQDFADSEGNAVGREQPADKVREENLELHRRLNLAPPMLSVMEPDGRFTWVNELVLQYLGISLADLTSDDLLGARVVHPDDLQKYKEERQRALASGVPFENEQRLRRKDDGQYRWFLVCYRPLKDAAGRVVRWYGSAIDIEDRKRAEQALRRSEAYLAEAQRLSHTGSWACTTNKTLYWSEEMFRIHGLDPQRRAAPDHEEFSRFLHPEDHDRVRERVEQVFREKADFTYDYRIVLADGTLKHLHAIGHPVLGEKGEVVEYVGTAVDVTERKRVEEEREKLRQLETDMIRAQNELLIKAQEAERMRIAGELHDSVLQQITSLTLRLGKVKRQVPPDSEATATVNSLQQQLIQIGTDIRQISHELHPALLQESGLPAALSAYCEEFSKVRGLPVSCETEDCREELSAGAAICLYRIAQEALGNAAKHSAAKKVKVRLTRAEGRVRLFVSDDGVGCAPDQIGKSGGMGVINMRERVLQLNGTFEFDSQPGHGTTVKAEVPSQSAS
jgi:PAS domain S-box-containing protein